MPNMTRYFPFDAGAGANVSEGQWREMAQHWVSDGVISSVGSALAVSATTGLTLAVAAGAAFIRGHYGVTDATTNVTLTTAHATLARIDRVVLRLDTSANTISIEVLTGTASGSPVAPALTQTSATWEISLATVAVAAAAVSIVGGNITDARTLLTPQNGLTATVTAGTGTSVSGAGTIASPFVVTATARPQLANPIRNASMQIAQRGTSFALAAATRAYTLDGWEGLRSVTGATISQNTGATDTQGSQSYVRVQRDNGNTSTATITLGQSVTTAISRHLAGKQVTFSFRARAGSNYSAAAGALAVNLVTGTGTDQNVIAGLTGAANAITPTTTLTTAWQTFTGTATLSGSITQLGVTFVFTPVGTASAADYFDVKDVRIDEGPQAQQHTVASYPADLADAQHYVRVYGGVANEAVATGYINTGIYGASALEFFRLFDTPMRANPTATLTGNWEAASADGTHVVGTLTTITYTPRSINFVVYRSSGAAVATNRSAAQLRATDSSARFVVTAEI